MNIEQIYNAVAVEDSVLTAGLLNEVQLAELGAAGIELVINLLPDWHDYAVKNEAHVVGEQGIAYHYIPIEFDAPKPVEYEEFERLMLANKGKKMLVHCAANYRVSAFYSIYAYRHLGWSEQRCQQHVSTIIGDMSEYPAWQVFLANYISA